MSSLSLYKTYLGDDYVQNTMNDEMFYKKNENTEEFFIIPTNLAKANDKDISELTCIFCQNISIIPLGCSNCNMTACYRCINNYSSNQTNFCEKTKEKHQFSIISEETHKNFDNLLISCPSRESNCKELIKYKEAKSHLDKCNFWKGTYSCIGCKKHDILSEMECHVLVCDEITENCNYCNLQFKRSELGKHMEVCDQKTMICDKCNENISSKSIEKHISKDECLYKVIVEMKNSFDDKFRQYECRLELKDNLIKDLAQRIKNLEERLIVSDKLHENHLENHKNHEEKIQHIYYLLFEQIEIRYKDLNDKLNSILKKITELKFSSNDPILEDPEFIKKNQDKSQEKKLTKIKNLICIKTLSGHQGPISCIIQMKWDKDCKTIVSGSSDKSIKVWNAEEGTCLKTLLGHIHWVFYLCQLRWKKDQSTIISSSRDMTLKIWNIDLGICLKSINAHNNLISGITQIKNYMLIDTDNPQFSSDNSSAVLVSCSWDRLIKVWNLEDGSLIKTLKGHKDSVRCITQMKWKKDPNTILSGASDKTIKIWDTSSGECKMTLTGHTDSVYHLEFIKWDKDDFTFASASYDKSIKIWDLDKGICIKTLLGHTHYVNNIFQLKWEGEETLIVSGSFDKSIRLWNIESGKILKSLKGHSEYVMGMSQLITDKDYVTIISGSGDNSIKIWE